MAIVNPPEFAQTGSYTAKRWRMAVRNLGAVQPGVWDGFVPTPDASGWGFSLSGGSAYVDATLGTLNKGMYHVEADTAPALTGTLTPAHATLPRIDQIAIQVDDTVDSSSPDDIQQILVATGTPTSGATLGNRTGAATLPGNTLRLTDVLVPGGSASAAAATFRDRRTMARGVLAYTQVTSGDLSSALTTYSTLAQQRVNIGSAVPGVQNLVQLIASVRATQSVLNNRLQLAFQYQINDNGTWVQMNSGRYYRRTSYSTTLATQMYYTDFFPMGPNNYQFRVAYSPTNLGGTMTASANATMPARFWVREIVRPVDLTNKATP